MSAPKNSPPVELVDAAVKAWFDASPRAALIRDQQEHFRERMRAVLSAIGWTAGDMLTTAAFDVLAERKRQITAEGWTPDHDDQHDTGELASAAASYAQCAGLQREGAVCENAFKAPYVENWPWSEYWWKPSTEPRRNLVKAGALILAEIERLDRAAIAQQSQRKEA